MNIKQRNTLGILILAFLKSKHNSYEKSIKGKQIVGLYNSLGYNLSEPELRRIINGLRSIENHPILATSKGYYYCKNKEEIELQVISLKERERSIRKARKGLEALLKK